MMIVACCNHGHDGEALNFYSEMKRSGIVLDHLHLQAFCLLATTWELWKRIRKFIKKFLQLGMSVIYFQVMLLLICV